jgi:hypothetical protein
MLTRVRQWRWGKGGVAERYVKLVGIHSPLDRAVGESVMTTSDAPYPDDLDPVTQFTPQGDEVDEFRSSDFGVQAPWSKEDLRGHTILVVGISSDTFESDFGIARSMKYELTGDDAKVFAVEEQTEPWGFLFSEDAPILNMIRRHTKNGGHFPFKAIFDKVASQGGGREYWTLRSTKPPVQPTPMKGKPRAR